MRYQCRLGHIVEDPDYCRACLAGNYGVTPVQDPPASESKPEELTPVITPVKHAKHEVHPEDADLVTGITEGAPLPESKHSSKHHGKR